MKKLFTLLAAVILTVIVFAQAPEKMSYQAVIRDASNNLVCNHSIGMQITILQGSENGISVYRETQSAMTNANGLVGIEIGELAGFITINWENGPFFIKTETDPTGGSNYTITGTSQLMSVPYALYAKKSGNDSQWKTNYRDIYYNSGYVGIGTNAPSTNLEIIKNNTAADGNSPDAVISIKNNNYSRYRTTAYSNTPHINAQIQGIRARGTIDNPLDALPGDRVFGVYGHVYENREINYSPIASMEYYVGDNVMSGEIVFHTLPPNSSVREERLRITEHGNIGIGTNKPKSKLQVANGDVYIENIGSGVIMKSPNGQCWRMTVDDSGNPVFSAITCP